MDDFKTTESFIDMITEARKNALAEEQKEKKKGKKPAIADTITKTAKGIDVWTPMNAFRFGLAGLLTVVKLGLTSSVALASTPWWLILLPAYILEGIVVAGLVAMGLLAVLYVAVLGFWTAFQILILDPIQRRRFHKRMDAATHSLDPRDDMLSEIHQAIMQRDAKQSN